MADATFAVRLTCILATLHQQIPNETLCLEEPERVCAYRGFCSRSLRAEILISQHPFNEQTISRTQDVMLKTMKSACACCHTVNNMFIIMLFSTRRAQDMASPSKRPIGTYENQGDAR